MAQTSPQMRLETVEPPHLFAHPHPPSSPLGWQNDVGIAAYLMRRKCPFWVVSGHRRADSAMSALPPPKADMLSAGLDVRSVSQQRWASNRTAGNARLSDNRHVLVRPKANNAWFASGEAGASCRCRRYPRIDPLGQISQAACDSVEWLFGDWQWP